MGNSYLSFADLYEGGGGGWRGEVVDSALPLVFNLCIFLLYPKPSY